MMYEIVANFSTDQIIKVNITFIRPSKYSLPRGPCRCHLSSTTATALQYHTTALAASTSTSTSRSVGLSGLL